MSSVLIVASARDGRAITSDWKNAGPSSEWLDGANWTNGVPQTVGDIARFTGTTTATIPVHVSSPATLSQTTFSGIGAYNLSGSTLAFQAVTPSTQPRINVTGASNGLVVTIANPLSIADGQTLAVNLLDRASLNLNGVISGDAGLAFTGAPIQRTSRIGGNNTYTGLTTFDFENGFLVATTATAFGNPGQGTLIKRGSVVLQQGTAEEFVVERRGSLLPGASTPQTGKITLAGGSLNPFAYGVNDDNLVVTVPAEIAIRGRGHLGDTGTAMTNNVLTGPITGDGLLVIEGGSSETITIQGEVRHRGDVQAAERSNATINGKFNPAGDLIVSGGVFNSSTRLRLAGDASEFHGDIESRFGNLTLATDVDARRLRVDVRRGNERLTFQRGGIAVESGSTLDVDQLDFFAGSIAGRITGIDTLRKKTPILGALSQLEGFDGAIAIDEGWIEVHNSRGLGTTAGATSINRRHGAVLQIIRDVRIEEPIYLNNSAGLDYSGSLLGPGEMAGDLYLGDVGSYVSGRGGERATGEERSGDLTISGRIHGGALLKPGTFTTLTINGAGHTYTGPTEIIGGTLTLAGAGRLESTSRVQVGGGRVDHSGNPRTTLRLDDRVATPSQDRIGDSVPVHLQSGLIELVGRNSSDSRETLGKIVLGPGFNRIWSAAGALHINQLERERTSVGVFLPSEGGRIEVDNPSLDDGILGGWALFATEDYRPRSFATVDSAGRVAEATLVERSLNGAGAHENISISSSATLAADVTVNAMRVGGLTSIDAAGKRLTVASGGLLSLGNVSITNGQLTAGDGAGPSELILHSYDVFNVGAAIVDNGGPLTLHVSGNLTSDGGARLSGVNTYTGGTVVSRSAALRVLNRQAIPSQSELVLNSGSLQVEFADSTPLHFARIVMRDSAGIGGTAQTAVDADVYDVYSGQIHAPLSGDGVFTKRGEGDLSFQAPSPAFVGPIMVEQGRLLLAQNAIGGIGPSQAAAITVKADGILEAVALTNQRLVILEGGALRSQSGSSLNLPLVAPVEVRGSGVIETIGNRTPLIINSRLFGQGQLSLYGPFDSAMYVQSDFDELNGDVVVAGGSVNLQANNSAYAGKIIVRAASASTSHLNAIGPGGAVIEREGTLSVGTNLAGPLQLAGGTVTSRIATTNLVGRIDVLEDSVFHTPDDGNLTPTFFNMQTVAAVTIADNVTLKKTGSANLTFAGGVRSGLNSRIVAWEGLVTLKGTVGPAEAETHGRLDLVGNNFTIQSSFQVPAGASFTLLRNGEMIAVPIAANARLSGAGTIVGDVSLLSGSFLSPGSSPGTLHVDGDLTVNSTAAYEWELLSVQGTPGAAWDLVDVEGDLSLDATPAAPWRLILKSITAPANVSATSSSLTHQWEIARADSVVGFNPAAVQIFPAQLQAARPEFAAGRFFVSADAQHVFLNYTIPEPDSLAMAALIGVLSASGCRRRRTA